MKRKFQGVWIPRNIWLSKELTLSEKVFLVEISSLDNEEGCYANNAHFAEFFQLTKGRISQLVKSLSQKGLITVEYHRDRTDDSIKRRVIRMVSKLETIDTEAIHIEDTVGTHNVSDTLKGQPNSGKADNIDNTDKIRAVILYFNELTGKSCSLNGKMNISLINNLLKEGYDVELIKKIIEFKVYHFQQTGNFKYIKFSTILGPSNFKKYAAIFKSGVSNTDTNEIMKHFNDITGLSIDSQNVRVVFLIQSLIDAKYTKEQIKKVTELQAFKWKGTEMAKHISPFVIFKRVNFEKYVIQIDSPEAIQQIKIAKSREQRRSQESFISKERSIEIAQRVINSFKNKGY